MDQIGIELKKSMDATIAKVSIIQGTGRDVIDMDEGERLANYIDYAACFHGTRCEWANETACEHAGGDKVADL